MKALLLVYKLLLLGLIVFCWYLLFFTEFDTKLHFWPIEAYDTQKRIDSTLKGNESSVINIHENTSEGNDIKQVIIINHMILDDFEFRKLEFAITNWSMMYIRSTEKKDFKTQEFSDGLSAMLKESSLKVMYGINYIQVYPMSEQIKFDKNGKPEKSENKKIKDK